MEIEKFTVEPNSSYEKVGKAEPNRARNQTKVEEERATERGNKKWIGLLLVALFFQALLLTAVVVAAGFFSKEIITFYGQIEQLREQVQYLKEQLHQANDTDTWLHLSNTLNSTTISNQLSDFQSSVNTFNATTADPLNNLQSSVNILNITLMDQQSSLQSSVDALTTAQNSTNTQVSSLQSSLNTLTAQQASISSHVTSLQSLMNNLTSQINSSVSVDIYKGCFEVTTNCTLSESSSDYWRACRTRSVYIDPSDTQYYTLDMRCEYSNNWDYIESGDIFKNGNSYFCDCDVTRLSSGASHATLLTVFPVCTLTVTRCPRSVSILN